MNYANNTANNGSGLTLEIAPQAFTTVVNPALASSMYWNLQTDSAGSANFEAAWTYATGQGVLVGLVDQGVNYSHQDLVGNYDTSLDYDPRDAAGTMDAMPDDGNQQHGTEVAGIIAASVFNDIGSIGAAPEATIAASYIRYGSDFSMTDLVEAMGQQSRFDVSNNSWGFTSAFSDNFHSADFDGLAAALAQSAQAGRDGLGTAMVVAGGNSKSLVDGVNVGDDSNFHNFSNSRFVIAVGAHDASGQSAYFSSPGTNILISAPGVGLLTTSGGLQNTDSVNFVSGTSFAAPLVSSAIALMLEVNPNLGYRDIQEILAITANATHSAGALANGAGNVNGGGMLFDREMGFGGLDAEAAVKLARTWGVQSTAANEDHIGASFTLPEQADASHQNLTLTLDRPANGDFSLDFVQLSLQISDADLKGLSIVLVSPDGTRAEIAPNLHAIGASTYLDFTFSSVATWGESPYGTWTLELSHDAASSDFQVLDADLDLYGDVTGADDTYYYTAGYAALVAKSAARQVTSDTDGGIDTLNFSAANKAVSLDLSGGKASALGSTALVLSGAFENAIGTVYADNLRGSTGDNTLRGDMGDDRLEGLAGNDILRAGDGDDVLVGGAGADVLDGGDGNDRVLYSHQVSINLMTGFHTGDAQGDTFRFIEEFTFSADDDRFVGSAAAESIFAGAGHDVIRSGGGADAINGGAGADYMAGGTGNDSYVVDNRNDVVVEAAKEGRDTVSSIVSFRLGANVEDLVLTGHAVTGTGNASANAITGNGDANTLLGLGGNDSLIGAAGSDRLDGGAGQDRLTGGTGNDIYVVDNGMDVVVEKAKEGNDTVLSSLNTYKLGAYVENLTLTGKAIQGIGNGLDNVITGSEKANILNGAAGDDRLFGNAGSDRLIGGSGDDRLVGGAGRDVMTGGYGHDTFIFTTALDSIRGMARRDVVTDYHHAYDKFDLSGIDARSGVAGNQGFNYIGQDDFHGKAGELHWLQVGTGASKITLIEADTDGNGVGDVQIQLTGYIDLTRVDFIL